MIRRAASCARDTSSSPFGATEAANSPPRDAKSASVAAVTSADTCAGAGAGAAVAVPCVIHAGIVAPRPRPPASADGAAGFDVPWVIQAGVVAPRPRPGAPVAGGRGGAACPGGR